MILPRNKTTEGLDHADRTADLSDHQSKQKRAMVIESDSESETPSMDIESPKTPEHLDNTTLERVRSDEAGQKRSETAPVWKSEDKFENSDLDLASNLSSSTEIDTEVKDPKLRSKRLTKTNPNIRYNDPSCHDYRKPPKRLNSGATPNQAAA